MQFYLRLVNLTKWRWPKVVVKHDRNFFTQTNLNFWIWPKFRTPMNITLPTKNLLVRSAWTGPPALALKLTLAGRPDQLGSSTRKKHQARILGGPRFQFWSSSIIKVGCCHDSVKFIRSSSFNHVNNHLLFCNLKEDY